LSYNPNNFLPPNFEKFILTGDFRKFLKKEVKATNPKIVIYLTGCGRSGTTLLFNLLSDQPNTID
jgi:hypothetical protein